MADLRWFHRLGIGAVEMFVYFLMIFWLYFSATPGRLGIITVDAFWLFIIVLIVWVAAVLIASLLTSTMRQDSFLANVAKNTANGIITIALMEWALFPILWLFGYSLGADVRLTMLIGGVIRWILKILLTRRWSK